MLMDWCHQTVEIANNNHAKTNLHIEFSDTGSLCQLLSMTAGKTN